MMRHLLTSRPVIVEPYLRFSPRPNPACGRSEMTESVSHQATLVSLQVGLPETVQANNLGSSGKSWTTGIFKSPVDGPVWLGAKNLRGDGQADLVHHGGVHKAVCAIPLIIFHSGSANRENTLSKPVHSEKTSLSQDSRSEMSVSATSGRLAMPKYKSLSRDNRAGN